MTGFFRIYYMRTFSDQLAAQITTLQNLIATVTANPQPTYSLDGESVSWSEYLRGLVDALTALKALQNQLPYEIQSRMTV